MGAYKLFFFSAILSSLQSRVLDRVWSAACPWVVEDETGVAAGGLSSLPLVLELKNENRDLGFEFGPVFNWVLDRVCSETCPWVVEDETGVAAGGVGEWVSEE
ncbi:hypothetical protein M0R45_006543 [Rubus argutus]|uniref:Uncharacterized protein n=1 Tax=Rubus argutus TaxID=59490 RepID=A0AAW1YQR3_RUBAR